MADFSNIVVKDLPPLLNPLPDLLDCTLDSTIPGNAFKIRYAGLKPISVSLFAVPLNQLDNSMLSFQADIRSETMETKAYLEMICFVNEGSYFSRDLLRGVSGTTNWRNSFTPFYLKRGEKAEETHLGIRMEGPGTIWIKNIKLYRSSPNMIQFFSSRSLNAKWLWVPGTFFGVVCGLYGSLAGILIPRGRGKGLILVFGYFLISLSLLMLLAGIGFLITGSEWPVWYAFLLPGLIGTVIMLSCHRMVLKTLRENEIRRMKAQDLVDLNE